MDVYNALTMDPNIECMLSGEGACFIAGTQVATRNGPKAIEDTNSLTFGTCKNPVTYPCLEIFKI